MIISIKMSHWINHAATAMAWIEHLFQMLFDYANVDISTAQMVNLCRRRKHHVHAIFSHTPISHINNRRARNWNIHNCVRRRVLHMWASALQVFAVSNWNTCLERSITRYALLLSLLQNIWLMWVASNTLSITTKSPITARFWFTALLIDWLSMASLGSAFRLKNKWFTIQLNPSFFRIEVFLRSQCQRCFTAAILHAIDWLQVTAQCKGIYRFIQFYLVDSLNW